MPRTQGNVYLHVHLHVLAVGLFGPNLLLRKSLTLVAYTCTFFLQLAYHIAEKLRKSIAKLSWKMGRLSTLHKTHSGQKTSARPPVRDEYSLISDEWIYESTCPTGRVEFAEKKRCSFLLRSEFLSISDFVN